MADKKWAILGIHGADVTTVEHDVARVRFFVQGDMIDKDVLLPAVPSPLTPSEAVYEALMTSELDRLHGELLEAGVNA